MRATMSSNVMLFALFAKMPHVIADMRFEKMPLKKASALGLSCKELHLAVDPGVVLLRPLMDHERG